MSLDPASRPTTDARLALARLPAALPLADALRRVAEAAADTLDVARAGVWLLADDRRSLRCAALFERPARVHSDGCTLRAADFPLYFAALDARLTVPAADAAADPRTGELAAGYLIPLGIASILDAAVRLDGRVAGVVCCEAVGRPRTWTAEEQDFAACLADVVALRLTAADQRADADPAEVRRREAVGRLAAGVAHDLKNLLTVTLAAADLLALKAGLPAGSDALLRQIVDATERGATLADELLRLGRDAGGRPRVVGAGDAVRAVEPLLAAAAGAAHPLTLDVRPGAGRVFVDPAQLERALLNLVVNARDASPVGEPIRVTVGGDAGGCVIAVTDAGEGMPAGVRERAFDPYFTTKGEGTGLGLAVVRQVAERAGGRASVSSEPGQGSTFRLHLPRVGE